MKIKETNPIEYWKYIRIGKAKKVLEDYEGAIEAYTKAIDINENKYNAYFYRGNVYSLKKDHDHSIKDYTEALKRKKSKFCTEIILEKRAKEFFKKSEYGKALTDLNDISPKKKLL